MQVAFIYRYSRGVENGEVQAVRLYKLPADSVRSDGFGTELKLTLNVLSKRK